MISLDEDALICDFAETYRIYDYRQLPARRAAVYACGLRQNSRIMMKICDLKVPFETLLLALIADAGKINVWLQTKDAIKGQNKPASIMAALIDTKKEKPVSFASPDDFMAWREQMMGG